MSVAMQEEEIEGGEDERDTDGTEAFQPFNDSDTATLFQDLERELEKMVQKYHVPPTDLESLFQVVQNLFEMMDTSRETYESLVEQKRELEDLWKTEKDKSKVAQRRRLELECRMEEERLRLDSEKSSLQRDKASLQTKLKQALEHKLYIEQELIRLKDKTLKDDQTRKDLLDTYTKQYDKARRSSLRRVASFKYAHRRLPIVPRTWETGNSSVRPAERIQSTPDPFQSSEDSLGYSIISGTASGTPSFSLSQSTAMSPPTLDMELEGEQEREREKEREGEREIEKTAEMRGELDSSYSRAFGESYEELPFGMLPPPPPVKPAVVSSSEGESEEEGAVIAPENREGLSLEEELMGAVGSELLAPARTELDMLLKEKESWQVEKERLEKEREDARHSKETVESQYAQLQVECQQLQDKHKEMQEELQNVRKERDEVLETYLDQPFDEYCITRKELLDLLRRHHNTTIELEKEKEEKKRLQSLLDAKKSFFERLKLSMRKMFNRYPRPSTSSVSSDRGRSFTPSDDQLLDTSHSDLSPPPAIPASPLTRTIIHSMGVTTSKGWLSSPESSVSLDSLPSWVGQITLSGIETERVEYAAVGRVFSSEETLGPHPTPPRSRFNCHASPAHLPRGVQQLHAEVWVATTENSASFIEIVDILSRTTKVRQRFVVKPHTAHIVCMKAVPGSVEESSEFTDSALMGMDTSWVEEAFSSSHFPRSFSDATPANKPILWHTGSASDLLNPVSPGSDGKRETGFTQSLSIPNSRAGHKASGMSAAIGELSRSSHVVRRLDFPLQGQTGPVMDATRASYQQPRSQSLSSSVRNQDTIPEGSREGLDSPDSSPTSLTEESVDSPDSNPIQLTGNGVDCPDSSPISLTREGVDGPNSNPIPVTRAGGRVGGCEGVSGRRERDRGRRTPSAMKTIMWVITEDNRLVFYPTTDPSHIPINSVALHTRALCIEYIKGKVYIGHIQSQISIFHPDEFMHETWDIQNPTRLSLPSELISCDTNVCYDVKCIALVGNELWVGAGPSVFFVDEQGLERRGSKFINDFHHRPEQILPVGDLVLVATKASALYVFDRQRHEVLRKFDVTPIISLLDSPTKKSPLGTFVTPTSIKCLSMDDRSIFVGTSSGHIVSIPIEKLSQKQSLAPPANTSSSTPHRESSEVRRKKAGSVSGRIPPKKPPRKGKRIKVAETSDTSKKQSSLTRVRSSESPRFRGSEENSSSEHEEVDGVFLDQSTVSLHCHTNKVRTLLHVILPRSKRDFNGHPTPKGTSGDCFNSMPNLSSVGYRLSQGQPHFKSLVVSVGRGHTEYSTLPPDPEQTMEDAAARRERNKAFQLMLWGHRNSIL